MHTASYWSATHTFPEFPTINCDIEVDVVVVGAGLTGITTAYLLKQEGARVALIERDQIAAGDTSRTTAHLTYVTDTRLHQLADTFGHDAAKAFWEAGAAAIDEIAAIARQTQADCGLRWTPGYLHASMRDKDAKERQLLEKDAKLARAFGFDTTFVEQVPVANRPGVRFARQATFHPLKYLEPLVRTIPGAVRRGVQQRLRGSRLAPPRQFDSGPIHVQRGRFAIVGDLQPTSRLEVWRQSNAQAGRQLIDQIVAECPDFLALVGDLVLWGASAAAWATFDELALPLWQARVPILPLLGNHDYGLARHAGLTHFFTRFPQLERRHWFSTTYGPLGLIFLDSNMRRLPAAHWEAQVRWYRQELARFERMPPIRGVLVLLHHPPYTNSTLVADSRAVQRTFVPPFLQSPKTLAMVAGHVHSYERYTRAGKTFLVTGGGGPRMRLATGRRRRHGDDCFAGPPLRGFHFLLLTLVPSGLRIAMQGWQQPQQVFETLDCFTLPWAPPSLVEGP